MKKILVIITSVISLSAGAQTYKGAIENKSQLEKLNDEYCSGLFQSTDGTIIDVASSLTATSYLNILDWLQGRIAGLQVYPGRNGISIPMIRGGVPAVYVDEVPVSLSYINSINTNDIAIIKIIKTPFYGGFNGGNGAIAIYTLGEEEEE